MTMTSTPAYRSHHTGSLYGTFAVGSVILSCFAGFLYTRNIQAPEWRVVLTFVLGAIYATAGILGGHCTENKGPLAHFLYFGGQCALLTALIFISPVRGYFGIIVLPVMSQAVFDLRTRNAVFVGIYLFAMSISVFIISYGWGAGIDATISYFTAFAFTIVFTIITKQALDSRVRE